MSARLETATRKTRRGAERLMSWSVDDAELLDAALSLLEGAEDSGLDDDLLAAASSSASAPSSSHSSNSSSSYATNTSSSSQEGSGGAAARTVNRSRERRRQELQVLRDEARTLCTQLEVLQRRQQRMLAPHDLRSSSARHGAEVWEGVAWRQFRSRRKAEQLNARLRKLLSAQASAVHDLLASMQRLGQQDEYADILASTMRASLPIEIRAEISEQEQLERLERLCQESHVAFACSPKFFTHAAGFLDVTPARGPCGEIILDTVSSWLVPFHVERVAEVAWCMKTLPDMEDGGVLFQQDIEAHPNRLVAVCTTTMSTDRMQGQFRGKYVSKRFRDGNGDLVFATYMSTKLQGFGLSDFDGIIIHKDTWVRTRDAVATGDDTLTHQTCIQVSERLRLEFGACDAVRDMRRVDALVGFLSQFAKGELGWIQFKVEDMLLHAAIEPHADAECVS